MTEEVKEVEDLERRDKSFSKRLRLTMERVVRVGKGEYRITEA